MNEYVLAIDIGTTNIKCVIARPDMTVLADAESEYPLQSPLDSWYEQDPESWWEHACAALADAAAKAGVSPAEIGKIAVSSQAPTMLPVDARGRPLSGALIWMDRRSGQQCERLRTAPGAKRVFEITGNTPDPFYVFSELLWFRQNNPGAYEKTACVLQANGYLNWKLTGQFSMDETHASLTQCYDVRDSRWSEEILSLYDIPESIFPPVSRAFDVIGRVSREAAAETGLREGAEVLAGSVDGAAAALEGGVSSDGTAVEMSGTSSVLLVGSEERRTSPNLTYMRSAIPGQHLLLGCMSTTGGALKWYRDNFCDEKEADVYRRLDQEIVSLCPKPSKLIFLPYLAGERAPIWDTHAKGVLSGITVSTRGADIVRAIEEGAAFALLDNISQAVACGARIRLLRAVGGSVRSRIWMQIKASAIGMPIEIPTSSLGAPGGMLAVLSYTCGEHASIAEAVDSLVVIHETIDPVAEWVPIYREKFELFRNTYQNLKSDFVRYDEVGAR